MTSRSSLAKGLCRLAAAACIGLSGAAPAWSQAQPPPPQFAGPANLPGPPNGGSLSAPGVVPFGRQLGPTAQSPYGTAVPGVPAAPLSPAPVMPAAPLNSAPAAPNCVPAVPQPLGPSMGQAVSAGVVPVPAWLPPIASASPPQPPAGTSAPRTMQANYQEAPAEQYGPAAAPYGVVNQIPPGGESPTSPLPSSIANYFVTAIGPKEYADYAPDGFVEVREDQECAGRARVRSDHPRGRRHTGRAFQVCQSGTIARIVACAGDEYVGPAPWIRAAGLVQRLRAERRPRRVCAQHNSGPATGWAKLQREHHISRFALETWTPTEICDWNVHTFIEGDFFNGPGQAAGGGGNPFRLRNAFFDFGYFRFGQQNSVFMDGSNWPSLVDFQGPNGWINQRQPSARMTIPLFAGWYWATSVERPFSDITTSGLGTAVQDVPDVATHLRCEGDLGHLQVSGMFRAIGYRPTGEAVTRLGGEGLSGSFVFHPWAILLGTNPVRDQDPSGLTRSRILLQCTWGPGIGRVCERSRRTGTGWAGESDYRRFSIGPSDGLERQL